MKSLGTGNHEKRRRIMKKVTALFAAALVFAAGVTGGSAISASAETDHTLVETTAVSSGLVCAPAVVSRLTSAEQMDKLSGGAVFPANLILTVDEAGKIVGTGDEEITSLAEAYAFCVEYGMIPVVEIKSSAAGEKFVEIWNSSINASDLAIMCADKGVLGTVRRAVPEIRGIYDCTAVTFEEDTVYEKVKEANIAMASVVLLNEAQSSPERVAAFQYRLKTVWTQLDKEHEGDRFAVQNLVSSGTFGIVSDSFNAVYSAYKEYPARSLARVSANIGHRGLPFAAAENSLKAMKLAYEAGATHVEIDVHLTSDKVPIVMHDGMLSTTTDYPATDTDKGVIANMTFEEVRQYHVIKNYGHVKVDPEPIPSVEEIFAEFRNKDVVVIVEIKTIDPQLFTILRPLIEKYDMWRKMVFISFGDDVLKNAFKDLPEIPTASLNTVNESNFEYTSAKYNSYNMAMNAGGMDKYPKLIGGAMKDRGYMCYSWTYDSAQTAVDATVRGVFGVTNNVANKYGERTYRVQGKAGQEIVKSALAADEPITVITRTYAGVEKERNGKILSVKDCGEYAEVIAYYDENTEYKVFTQAFRVDYATPVEPSNDEGSGGCKSSVTAGVAAGVALVAGGAVVLAKKKRRG